MDRNANAFVEDHNVGLKLIHTSTDHDFGARHHFDLYLYVNDQFCGRLVNYSPSPLIYALEDIEDRNNAMAEDILDFLKAYHERTDAWEDHEIEVADKFYNALSKDGKNDFDMMMWMSE